MIGPQSDNPQTDDRRRRIGIVLVLGLFALAGVWLLWVVAVDLVAYRRALTWPTVSADVLSAGVEVLPGAADGDDAYGVDLRYRYVVDGRAYESNRLRREGTESYSTRAAAEEVLAGYLAGGGQTVTVHYDTADPETAVLNVAPPSYLLLFVVFYWSALIFFTLSVVRKKRQARTWPGE